jgi:RNA-directed DNA polymerase
VNLSDRAAEVSRGHSTHESGEGPNGAPQGVKRSGKQAARLMSGKWQKNQLELAFMAGARDGIFGSADEGTPQGGPPSPLLSNIVLNELDRELERRGHRFVRYADDCNIYVRSERSGKRVMESVTSFISKKLKRKVNSEKSAVARPWERKFLGFSFTGKEPQRRRIAPKAMERFKDRVRDLTRRTKGVSLEGMVKELTVYLRGWHGYFGFCQTPSVLEDLDSWMRRKLRCVMWKQWKRGRTRYKELRKRGVKEALAAKTAGSPHGPWRLSQSPALCIAFPNAFFVGVGLFRLAFGR